MPSTWKKHRPPLMSASLPLAMMRTHCLSLIHASASHFERVGMGLILLALLLDNESVSLREKERENGREREQERERERENERGRE